MLRYQTLLQDIKKIISLSLKELIIIGMNSSRSSIYTDTSHRSFQDMGEGGFKTT